MDIESESESEADAVLGRPELVALVDLVVPADDWPSASQSGALTFLARALHDRPEWAGRMRELLDADRPTEHAEWEWFAELVSGGFYADEANGGNADARSWRMVQWRPEPVGGWPALASEPDRAGVLITPATLGVLYDAIVVGSGAGGGVPAAELAKSGRRVLVVEAGSWPTTDRLDSDHLRNPRSDWGLPVWSGPDDSTHPRVLSNDSGDHLIAPSDAGWGNNAFTVGGGTRVYGAQAWRFSPIDFHMATTYGTPEGSALADWPFGYDELEPYYQRAEWEMGVSGLGEATPHAGHRSRPYPMPPLPGGVADTVLGRGAAALGIPTLPPPLLINSKPYLGRAACAQCAMCVGFACPVDAKNGSQNTTLAAAFDTGNCSIIVETSVLRLLTDAVGQVIGARVAGMSDGSVWTADVYADDIVLAAGATETARLLLNSTSEREPNGIGNNADQVGRHLQAHLYGGATAIFDDDVVDLLGPGPSIATTLYQHGNPGIVGGGMIANEFVPTPSNTYRYLVAAGLIPSYGAESKAGMRRLANRMMRIMGPIQEVTSHESRVSVAPGVTDRFGMPVARLSGSNHDEDYRGRDFLTDRAAEWLQASGARSVVPLTRDRSRWAPSSGQHQAGTCRMGDDPARSVVDPVGRVWGHDNVRITDASVHVTNGGVNPVLTVIANAFRTMDRMLAGR
ncbi:GMC oxidoreductase [Humibacter sp. RRB41]|uniref:GMC oxidoreductase n=1 Tax=Humibacter sp. RRB41 TaxID=2919946 RepID=UPI001FAA4361|nr:GMC oxidoreductase [Humibacter sp. RRB41]